MKTKLSIPQLDDPKWLRTEYKTKSIEKIALELGVHRNTVRNRFVLFNIDRSDSGRHLRGKPRTEEVRQKMSAARKRYWQEYPASPEFKLKVSKGKTKHRTGQRGTRRLYIVDKGRVLEHRHLIEQAIGRPLLPTEHVHHIDGNPSNNALENLQLMSNIEHLRLHAQRRRPKGSNRFV